MVRLFASIITMNLLWGVWMVFIERAVVGMAWAAVTDLRLSALLWNTAAAVLWTGHIERALSQRWHDPLAQRYRWARWYLVALGISLISQVPVQVAAYVPPMIWGDAVWAEVRWSWSLALLFSPVVGVYFVKVQTFVEQVLDLVPGVVHAPRPS
jgi:hypothetical protein